MAYQIQKGDTLSSIAKKQGTTTQAILDANKGIKDPNKIYAGSNLNIPKAESGQKPVQPTIPPVAPVVQPAVPKVDETITTENIKPVVSPINLPDAKTPTYAGVDGAVESVINSSRAQKAMDEQPAQANYLQAILDQGTISSSIDRQEQDRAKRESDKYTSMLEQEQLAGRRRIEKIRKNETGMLSSGIAIEEDRLNRESLSKQADIAILQTAANRNYDTAASIADRAVQLKLEQSKANLEALKLLDSREYGEITQRKEREYEAQLAIENQIKQLKLNVAQYGGGLGLLNQLSAIDTTKPNAFDEAVAIAGKYATDPLDRAIKNAQLNKLNKETVEAPTIKSINGVDMQWNGSAWIPAKVAGADGSDINNPQVYQEKINQFNSLINTANEAVELKKGAGNSGIKRAFNKTFVGSSKETQLQALTDTLKTNLLTLKGDPNLKKFFGPQMSDNDTRLMLSASSPIDVKSMTPDQVESYIKEISGFLERKKQEISIDYSQRIASQYIDGISGLMTAQSITNLYPDPKKK